MRERITDGSSPAAQLYDLLSEEAAFVENSGAAVRGACEAATIELRAGELGELTVAAMLLDAVGPYVAPGSGRSHRALIRGVADAVATVSARLEDAAVAR